MPIETKWYIKNRVVYQRHYGKMTVADFIQAKSALLAFLDEGNAPIHCVVSLINIETYPSLLEMQKFAQRSEHPSTGWTILVINNTVIRFISSLLVQLATKQFKTVSTMQEAWSFLCDRDSTLISLKHSQID